MAQVPATSYESTSLGDVAEFTIPFPFLSRAEVFVTVDGASVPFTWINDGLVQLAAVPELGAAVRRYRSTAAYVPLHQFSTGVPFLPRYVDRDFKQTLYAVQESVNETAGTAAQALATAEESLLLVQDAFDILSERTQYIVLGAYGPGLNFQTTSQVFSYLGEFYAPGPSITLPYTTTGVGAAEIANFRSVGDAILRGDLASNADPAKGAALVGYRGETVRTALDRVPAGVFTFAAYGAVNDGATNSTAQCQAAVSAAIAAGGTLDISGNYAVTSLSLAGANGLRVTGRGSIVGIASVATPSVLDIRNAVNVAIDGTWFINGNYNTNYSQAVWVYTDGAGQAAAYLDITNLSPVNCKLAYKFGNDNRPDDLVSEINIRGGNTYGCPSVVEAVGAQTVVNFSGCTLASLTGAGNPAWQALPQRTIVARGATVNISGGELLHVLQSTGGASPLFNSLCHVEVLDGTAENSYGKICVTGALVETAAVFGSSSNNASLPLPVNGTISFVGCQGVANNLPSYAVETDPGFTGVINFSGNSFFATTVRSLANIFCGGLCHVYCDKQSFGKNFPGHIVGVIGGILHHEHQMVLQANNLAAQSLTSVTPVTLNFQTVVNTGSLARFTANYAAGVLTVPAGGWKDVTIESQMLKSGLTGEWYVQIDGLSKGVRTLGNYNSNTYSVGNLNAGQTIKVVLLNTGGTVLAGTADTDWFHVFASA